MSTRPTRLLLIDGRRGRAVSAILTAASAAGVAYGATDLEQALGLALFFLGIPATIFGVVFTLGLYVRRDVWLDRALGKARVVRPLLGKVVAEKALAPLARVRITREERTRRTKSGVERYHVYPVGLEGDEGALSVTVETSYFAARRVGERAAAFLRLPLHDEGDESPVVRDPDHLDETVHARLRRLGQVPRRPGALATQRYVLAVASGGRLEARLPAPGFDFVSILFALGSALFAGAVFLGEILPDLLDEDRAVDAAAVAAVLFPLAMGLTVSLSLAFHKTTVIIDGERLVVRRSVLGVLRWSTRIPLARLEELDLRQAGDDKVPSGIRARSDDAATTFGDALPAAEQRHLRDTLLHHLATTTKAA